MSLLQNYTKFDQAHISCHPREVGDPEKSRCYWIPAYAGMTVKGNFARGSSFVLLGGGYDTKNN